MLRLPATCWMACLLLCPALGLAADPNHPPTINPTPIGVPDGVDHIGEDTGITSLTIGGVGTGGEAGQTLSFSLTSDKPGLILPLTTTYDQAKGQVTATFSTVLNANGTARLTLTVRDDGGGTDTASMSFSVRVSPMNDPPQFTAFWPDYQPDLAEGGAAGYISLIYLAPGPPDESGQRLTIVATPMDPTLVVIDHIEYTQGASAAKVWVRATSDIRKPWTNVLITVLDDSFFGGGHVNAASAYALVPLAAVNDPPVVAVNASTAAVAGGWAFLTGDDLLITDEDGDDPLCSLASLPVHGVLTRYDTGLDAFVDLGIGDSWRQSDIAAGRLAYRHDGSAVGPGTSSDAFSFTYSDGIIAVPLGPTAHQLVLAADPAIPPAVELYAAPWTFTEGDAPLAIAPTAVVLDPDSPDLAGGRIHVAFASGAGADDRLSFASQGVGAGQISVAGEVVAYGSVPIGTLSGGSAGVPLEVRFTGSACTPAAVQALLRTLTFANPGESPGGTLRRIEVVIDDGDGGVSPPAGAQVAVTPVEDPPALPITRIATTAWTSRIVRLPVDDPDGGSHAWTITRQPATAVLTALDAAAGLYTLVSQAPGEETFAVEVSDGVNPVVQAEFRLSIGDGDGVRPHPAADPPRVAVAGEELVVDLPFDTGDLGAGASVDAALTSDAPAGAALTATGAATVRLSWVVPADETPGSYRRFAVVAADHAGRGASLVPFILRIAAPPAASN